MSAVFHVSESTDEAIVYPDSDGKPMADNTLQFEWIVTIKEGLDACLRGEVFVAGDLLWYPVEGMPKICQAPDVMVVFGRPKGHRRSYKQWEENGRAPHVVFEILSLSNNQVEMIGKFSFYERYGVEEFYLYDPYKNRLSGYCRKDGLLAEIEEIDGWTSPRLGIRFVLTETTLEVYRSDGRRLESYAEIIDRLDVEQRRADAERERAETEARRAEAERERAEAEARRAEQAETELARLREKLRQAGLDA